MSAHQQNGESVNLVSVIAEQGLLPVFANVLLQQLGAPYRPSRRWSSPAAWPRAGCCRCPAWWG